MGHSHISNNSTLTNMIDLTNNASVVKESYTTAALLWVSSLTSSNLVLFTVSFLFSAINCNHLNYGLSVRPNVTSPNVPAYKSYIQFECAPGYSSIQGEEQMDCLSDGTWSNQPFCLSKYFCHKKSFLLILYYQ